MRYCKTWIATLAGALVALPAVAAEGAEPGGVFAGNVGNALWTLVIFGLVVFVLGKFAWKPILGGLQQREQYIRASLEQAKKDREEAEARLKEYVDKLNSARAEATAIVEEARRDAEVVRRRIEEEGRAESSAIVERARREVTIAAETAKKELYEVSAKLATELAGRLLGREIQAGDHDRLIRESIDSIERGGN
jgi:F-type H+-transporting ATPase subunit b